MTTATNSNLFEKSVALTLTLNKLGIRKKVPTSAFTFDADETLIKVSKEIIDCDEFRAITSLDAKIRNKLKELAFPIKKGLYIVPAAGISEADAIIEGFRVDREALINSFYDVYEAAKSDAQDRLGDHYNESDYPDGDHVKDQFSVEVQYISFGVPELLQEVSPDIWRREQEKAQREWAEASNQIKLVLRTALAELVNHLLDRLTGVRDDGRPKSFKEATVRNIHEFIESFEPKNIVDDRDLATLVDRCKGVLNGVDAETLRSSDEMKINVIQGMTEVRNQLDELLVDRPRRRLVFD